MKSILKNKMVSNVLFGVLLVIIAVVVYFAVDSYGRTDLSDYVTVTFNGLDGFAEPVADVDQTGLYQKLSDGKNDAAVCEYIRELVDSVQVVFSKQDQISNGNSVKVTVQYDKATAKKAKCKFKNTTFRVKASDLAKGTNVDIFENVDVAISGVSPEAYATISNTWDDDFLKTISFSMENASELSQGDVVTVHCTTPLEDFMEHGYTFTENTKEYKVDRVNTYATETKDLNEELLTEIRDEALDTIKSETESMTFRMLYKATQDSNYLYQYNTENVTDSELIKAYFLKKNEEGTAGDDNYIYMIFKANITNGDSDEDVYFAFEYPNGILNADGSFSLAHNDEATRYQCGISYDDLFNKIITSKQDLYTTTELTNLE